MVLGIYTEAYFRMHGPLAMFEMFVLFYTTVVGSGKVGPYFSIFVFQNDSFIVRSRSDSFCILHTLNLDICKCMDKYWEPFAKKVPKYRETRS